MEPQKYFIATVQIAVYAESEDAACDAVSECLSTNLKLNGGIIDWQYIPPLYTYPQYAGTIPEGVIPDEGEAFTRYNEAVD